MSKILAVLIAGLFSVGAYANDKKDVKNDVKDIKSTVTSNLTDKAGSAQKAAYEKPKDAAKAVTK